MWETFKAWYLSLGMDYGVNPLIFGGIYLGAVPFFLLSIGWLVRRLRNKKSIVLPILAAGFFFLSAYLYLIIAGRNVPFWVYLLILGLIAFGVYSTWKKVRSQLSMTR